MLRGLFTSRPDSRSATRNAAHEDSNLSAPKTATLEGSNRSTSMSEWWYSRFESTDAALEGSNCSASTSAALKAASSPAVLEVSRRLDKIYSERNLRASPKLKTLPPGVPKGPDHIVELCEGVSISEFLDKTGISVRFIFESMGAFCGVYDAETLGKLLNHEDVVSVYEDELVPVPVDVREAVRLNGIFIP